MTLASRYRYVVIEGLDALAPTYIYRAWVYMLASLLSIVALLRSRSHAQGGLPLALAASGLLYHLTFFLLAQSDDYRYSIWTILTTVLTLFALPSALPHHWLRGKRAFARLLRNRLHLGDGELSAASEPKLPDAGLSEPQPTRIGAR